MTLLNSHEYSDIKLHPIKELNLDRETKVHKMLDLAKSFPLRIIVENYQKKHNETLHESEAKMNELVKFMALSATSDNSAYGMAGPIDEIWHTFLLHTKLYAKFCNTITNQFIHHRPNASSKDNLDAMKGYYDFLKDYEIILGEKPAEKYWPHKANSVDCDQDVECSFDCLTS